MKVVDSMSYKLPYLTAYRRDIANALEDICTAISHVATVSHFSVPYGVCLPWLCIYTDLKLSLVEFPQQYMKVKYEGWCFQSTISKLDSILTSTTLTAVKRIPCEKTWNDNWRRITIIVYCPALKILQLGGLRKSMVPFHIIEDAGKVAKQQI